MNELHLVSQWHQRAQIDYANHYMALYAGFNAWYRSFTQTLNDREALNHIKLGCTLWSAYCAGTTLRHLVGPMRLLVECTQRRPLPGSSKYWNGEVGSIYDWPSLVEFWYRVRCLVMHGAEINPRYVYLAYETLNLFLGEVLQSTKTNTVYNTSKKRYN